MPRNNTNEGAEVICPIKAEYLCRGKRCHAEEKADHAPLERLLHPFPGRFFSKRLFNFQSLRRRMRGDKLTYSLQIHTATATKSLLKGRVCAATGTMH